MNFFLKTLFIIIFSIEVVAVNAFDTSSLFDLNNVDGPSFDEIKGEIIKKMKAKEQKANERKKNRSKEEIAKEERFAERLKNVNQSAKDQIAYNQVKKLYRKANSFGLSKYAFQLKSLENALKQKLQDHENRRKEKSEKEHQHDHDSHEHH